jgi:hypothetical protein
MHVSDGSHNCVFINTVCYFFIDLIPIIGAFLLYILRIDWRDLSTMLSYVGSIFIIAIVTITCIAIVLIIVIVICL